MEEESPEVLEKLEAAYTEAMNELSDISGWEPIKDWADLYTFRKPTEYGLDKIKIEAYIDRPPNKVCDYFYENLQKSHYELNREIVLRSEMVRSFSNGTGKVMYDLIHVPFPGISDREAVIFCKKLQFDENTCGFVDTSINYDGVETAENAVRCDVKYGLHIFEPLSGNKEKTHLTTVGLADPKGSIPTSMVNLGLGRRSDFYRAFIDILLKNI
ncbi:unnamed protein product [Blepharisma stoltei]|uniref:START domain-containing protein n=1 Tax=Blepharisma stoltei TaxID=1481888 RepID=A0AAU9ITN5_9CILI|nr:unnamed protein product [Blepharisma stoltei]